MALNYASVWEPELLEIMVQNALTSPFITSNVRWLDAKTFHFTQMATSGFKAHSRNGGWQRGTYSQEDVPFTLTHDRDIAFAVDKADVDETNKTASIQNIARVFEETQAVPEADALFFEKVAQKAIATNGLHSATAAADYTVANVYGKLKGYLTAGKLRRYRADGSLIMYVTSAIMDLLERSTDFTRKIEMTQISEGGIGIETRITDIDGIPVMEVIDDDRFYTEFDYSDGFAPKTGAYKINVLIASTKTVKAVTKINSIYYAEPGDSTFGDSYAYMHRQLSDVFVMPNGLDKKIDSVYVDRDTTAVA